MCSGRHPAFTKNCIMICRLYEGIFENICMMATMHAPSPCMHHHHACMHDHHACTTTMHAPSPCMHAPPPCMHHHHACTTTMHAPLTCMHMVLQIDIAFPCAASVAAQGLCATPVDLHHSCLHVIIVTYHTVHSACYLHLNAPCSCTVSSATVKVVTDMYSNLVQ